MCVFHPGSDLRLSYVQHPGSQRGLEVAQGKSTTHSFLKMCRVNLGLMETGSLF
jgi:hypothetical protein